MEFRRSWHIKRSHQQHECRRTVSPYKLFVEAGTLFISAPSMAGDLTAIGGTLRLDGAATDLGSKNLRSALPATRCC
jgi:hypothetical protein